MQTAARRAQAPHAAARCPPPPRAPPPPRTAADTVDGQLRPDQVRGDVMDASREKSAAEERGFCLGHTEPREPEQHTPSWYSSERRRRSNDRVRISDFRDRLASPAAQFGAAG